MRAVIMAGGEGTRLRPLTCNRPKPMVPIINKPVMEHIINLLKKHNITDIAVTLQYMPDMIKEYFGDGKDFGVNIVYYIEEFPLGTAGSVKNATDFLEDTFLVISGDALTDVDLSKAIDFHFKNESLATIVLKKVDVPLDYGVVVLDDNGRIRRFLEKPSWSEVFSDTANTGIYILSHQALDECPKNQIFDFSKDLFPKLLDEKKALFGYITDDYWCDVGDLKAYVKTHMDILDGYVDIEIPGRAYRNNVWVGENTEITKKVLFDGPCVIGNNCKIKSGAQIDAYSVIGDNSVIGVNNKIRRSIVWNNSIFDKDIQARGAIICNKVNLGSKSSVFEGSVIGESTVIRENTIIKQNVKIWPGKVIEENNQVNGNVIWQDSFSRSLFGNRGVSGKLNIDLIPEQVSKIASAFASQFKGKRSFLVSCDENAESTMLKMAFSVGLISMGAEVLDFDKTLLPISRAAVKAYGLNGGVYISSSKAMGKLHIDFINNEGGNIDRDAEKKIENILLREDFTRSEATDIKEVKSIIDYDKLYMSNIIDSIKSKELGYRIAISTDSKIVRDLMEKLAKKTKSKLIDINMWEMEKRGSFDLGVYIEDNGEKMTLIDEKGRLIDDDMFIVMMAIIYFKTVPSGTVVAPISASRVIEKIADVSNGKVIRSKTSQKDFMSKIISTDEEQGINGQFIMHFDAIFSLIKILDFMKINKLTLSEIVNMIPDFYINKEEVACPWNIKGKVIRELIEEHKDQIIETTEGVKIYKDDGWILVLPDSERPVCSIICENSNEEYAKELTNVYVNKVLKISSNC